MGKIEDKFKRLKEIHRKAFIVYLTFGFPSVSATSKILLALNNSPVDIIEIGLPFSDPLADGPILQEASSVALKKGADTDKFFSLVKGLKNRIKIPLIVMTYYNPVLRFGLNRFLAKAKDAGLGGVMVVDLPLEESAPYVRQARRLDLDTVFFITSQTPKDRIKKIIKSSRGFTYYISITGVTGPRKLPLEKIGLHLSAIRRMNKAAVCVGFGIYKKSQVKSLMAVSDGVVVGSSIVKFVKDNHKKRNFTGDLNRFLKGLYV